MHFFTRFPARTPSCLRARRGGLAALLAALVAFVLAGCGGGGGITTPPTPPPPVIITLGLPDGLVGVSYSFTLQALSGQQPFAWAVSAGALPAGLSLNASTGVISGTPTTAETRTFTIRLTDAANQSVTRDYTVAIGELTPLVERVSLAADGGQANSDSGTPSLSDDARFMAFTSFATNLVAADTNNFPDIFLRDFSCNQNVLVSVSSSGVQANNISFTPVVSGLRSDNHLMVVYGSTASNLVADDTNGGRDIFVTALDAGACPPVVVDTIRVSVASDGSEARLSDVQPPSSLLPSISANGLVVAYHSDAKNLDPFDINDSNDVFVTDLAFSGGALSVVQTRRISVFPGRLAIGVGRTTADIHTATTIGRSDLAMTDDEHIGREVHIFEGIGAGLIRAIVDNDATTLTVDPPWNPVPTDTSVFRIVSRELITADIFSDTTLGRSDLTLVEDEHRGQLVDIVAGTGAGQRRGVIDNDATTLTVNTAWSPLPDATSVFRLVRQGSSDSFRGRVSPDAAFVLFDSGSIFEEEDDNSAADLFLYDLASDTAERLSRTFLNRPGNGSSNAAALAAAADLALFISSANNFVFELDPTPADIFTANTIGNSGLALVPDAHVDDIVLIVDGVGRGQSRVIKSNTNTTLTVENDFSPVPDATSVFAITADTNNVADLFLLDLGGGVFDRLSVATDGTQADGGVDANALFSATGSAVVFSTLASNLVPGDTNNVRDIYFRNRDAVPNTTSRISRAMGDTNPNAECVDPALSLDGSAIAFSSTADNLVPGDTNNARDIFLVTTGISDPPGFVFSKLSAARVGQPFSKQLPALGGAGQLFYSLAGGALPPGLFLDPATGTLSGIPQQAGRFQFTLVVSDSARPPRQSRKTLTLVVDP